MDSAPLLSIMEKDGRTTMPEAIGSRCSHLKVICLTVASMMKIYRHFVFFRMILVFFLHTVKQGLTY